MFTFVIVAFVILLALTAFVPRVRGWMQWVFKKAALVLNLLVLFTVYTLALLVIWLYLVLFGVIYWIGKLLSRLGNWALAKLSEGETNLSHFISVQVGKAVKRFR